ncbi:ATP-dependent translocase ABCB1-like [Littorina saxatilis]|uniref:Uncharacterized protein n=1 Tax=Littorina saxatilis TaxID=31220 RepID=A0AAN9AV81_9CAEN
MAGGTDERTPLLAGTAEEREGDDVSVRIKNGAEESKDDKAPPPRVATMGELFSFATCLDNFLIMVGSVSAMGVGAGFPLMAIVLGGMTDDFIKGPNGTLFNSSSPNATSFDFESSMNDNTIKMSYIGAGVLVCSFLQVCGWVTSSERQIFKMRRAFFKAILRQDMAWFDTNPSGELTTRLTDDLERVRDGMGDKFGMVIRSFAQFLSGLTIGFVKGWQLSLVMLSVGPLLAISFGFMIKLTTSLSQKEQAAYAKAGSVAEEVFSCIRTVISFGGWRREKARYNEALEESQKLGVKKSLVQGLGIGITMLCIFGSYGLAFWYGSTQVNDYLNTNGDEGLSPGDVLTVFFCVMSSSMALGQAAPNMGSISAAKGAGGKVFELIKRTPSIDSSSLDGERPRQVEGRLDFKGVSFAYPTRPEIKVLKSFNVSVKPGQTVALVGGSGCGKSTIIKLIQRFYDPLSGEVELDGRNITGLNPHWLRRHMGIVSQEPVLFGCSIRDNIRLGQPDVTDEEIIKAATDANAHTFISGLPKGYDTLVGERGAQLSGGQKQRVAIARALVRNPRILLLDEATSALDSESEKIVQSALDKARQGRTTVVVAHRLSTIQNADVIYVLNGGELAESGSHSELMERGGLYHQLVTLQQIVNQNDEAADTSVTAILDGIIQSESETEEMKMGVSNGSINPGLPRQRSQPMARQLSRQTSQATTRTRTKSEASVKEEEPTETEEAPKKQPSFCEIMSYNAKEWPFIVFGCFTAILNGATMPVFAIFFSKIIAVFSEKGDELLKGGIFWSLMFVALGGLNFVTNIIQNYCFGQSGERLTKRLRLKTFENLLRQDVSYFDDPHHATGALTARLSTDASVVKTATGIRIAVAIQSLTGMVTGVVIAFVYGWKLALVVLGTMPFMGVASAIQVRVMMGNQKADTKQLEVAGKTSSETIDNISTVQSLTREPYFYDKYCQQLLKPYRKNLRNAQVYAVAYAFSSSIIFFIYAGSFRFGAYLVGRGEMDAENVFKVFMAMTLAGQVVGQASSFLPDYGKGRLAAAYIFRMMRAEPLIDNFSTTGLQKDAKGEIELQKVEFHYPTRQEIRVLKGISIHIGAGQTAALVGISGCGKSTIISLLQRYYDPTKGQLLIDGIDIREYNINVLRSLLSVVSQEPVLFDCSVRDNIVYGLEGNVPMADVIEACKTANIHQFIAELPQGYDTQVGGKGTQLSGGQKQRVAIARALVRNPRILLLDEATSALDTESEKLVQTALDNAREGRTCIVIAHRLSTIMNADIIFVMEDGQVLEQGTHQELLAKQGAYSGFVNNQKIH